MKIFLLFSLIIFILNQSDDEYAFKILTCLYKDNQASSTLVKIIEYLPDNNIDMILNTFLTDFSKIKGVLKKCMIDYE